MKTLLADDNLARGIREGRITLLVLPMEPPPEQESIADYKFDLCYRGVFDYGSNGKNWLEFAPYAPGDIVGVKETYARWSNDHSEIIYSDDPDFSGLGEQNVALNRLRANPAMADLMECVGFFQKVPAESMPDEAIRTRLRILTVEARLVRSITPKEVQLAGVEPKLTVCRDLAGAYYGGNQLGKAPSLLAGFVADWRTRHPDKPFERAWGWMTKFSLKEG